MGFAGPFWVETSTFIYQVFAVDGARAANVFSGIWYFRKVERTFADVI